MSWITQKYPPTGGTSADGLVNALGKPKLDPLELMTREAVQNSWDARLNDEGPIDFKISLNDFHLDQFEFLNNTILSEAPEVVPNINEIKSLGENYLLIEDRKTKGLTGPVLISDEDDESAESDYIDFVLKSGAKRDKALGGGTYGFGKTSFYKLSKISTIIIFTNTTYNNKKSTRLIIRSIGKASNTKTGVAFYGKKINEETIEPFQGEEAVNFAQSLGFSSFNNDETGTSIMVLFPNLGNNKDENSTDRSDYQSFIYIISTLYWNLWPKMFEYDDQLPINFKFFLNFKEYKIFPPEDHPQLENFVNSMIGYKRAFIDKKYRKFEKNILIKNIDHKSLKQHLGILSMVGHGDISKDNPYQDEFTKDIFLSIFSNSPLNNEKEIRSNHVALMRNTELVVTYFEGPPREQDKNYSGVFVSDSSAEIDEAFANSEPPAHDNWSEESVIGKEKKIVSHAKKTIRSDLNDFSGTNDQNVEISESESESILNLQDTLGSLLIPMNTSTGASKINRQNLTKNEIRNRAHRNSIHMVGSGIVVYENEIKTIRAQFQTNFVKEGIFKLIARGNISIENGSIEKSSPEQSELPEFLYWTTPNNEKIYEKECKLSNSFDKDWSVTFTIPKKSQIIIEVEFIE